MIEKFLDPYELKARIVPGLILALAPLIALVSAAPVLGSLPIFAASGVCSLALVYFLGSFARARGEAIEHELWNSWGGPPSTRLLRHRDSHFGHALKASIRHALTDTLSVSLLTADEEAANQEHADRVIVDAFRQVRQYIRQHDPDGLWQKQNIEYGFYRNLLGCRITWSVLSVGAALFAAIHGARTGAGILTPAGGVALISLFCAVYIGWFVLPDATRRVADEYAEKAWMAFLSVSNEKAYHPQEAGRLSLAATTEE